MDEGMDVVLEGSNAVNPSSAPISPLPGLPANWTEIPSATGDWKASSPDVGALHVFLAPR